jgi:hypothetical protein
MADAPNNTAPGLLNRNDHVSGLVPARYRLNSARKTPASSAHNAKKITGIILAYDLTKGI